MKKNRLLWNYPVDHDRNTEWIMTVKKELECVKQKSNINITKEDVSIHLRRMSNWKASGPNGLHRFWLKENNFSSPGNSKTFRWLYSNRGCSELAGRKSDSPYTERCEKWECCWQLQTNSLL